METRWEPQGARVGWLDGDELYLDKAAAYRAASEMDGDGIGVSPETLAKRLHQAGYLASISSEREGRLTVRRRLEGALRRVLHLHPNAEGLSLSRQTGITGITGNGQATLNSEAPPNGVPAVPGGVGSGSKTGSKTGNRAGNAGGGSGSAIPAAVPGVPGPASRPGPENGPERAPAELDFGARSR